MPNTSREQKAVNRRVERRLDHDHVALPVDAVLPDVVTHLARSGVVVVTAPPRIWKDHPGTASGASGHR